jgi:hypothetical protein
MAYNPSGNRGPLIEIFWPGASKLKRTENNKITLIVFFIQN